MNKITTLLSFTIIMTLFGCKTSPENEKINNSSDDRINELTKIYSTFYDLGDAPSCIYTLQNILFLDTTKTEYYDSLVFHYAQTSNFKATEKMISKSLEHGKNIKVMEYSVGLSRQKGELDVVTTKLAELFALTQDYRYKVSLFQMSLELNDVKGAEKVLSELESLENMDSINIEQVISETETQLVPLKAVLLLGNAQIEAYAKRNAQAAMKYITKSLEIKPDFQNALAFRNEIIKATQQK